MSPFFRIDDGPPTTEDYTAFARWRKETRAREKKEPKARSLARSRSYNGNFQASGFPENLWRGHSLDRHEQCSPSFIRPCYRSGPFGPAGVTRVIRERCIHARERTWLSSDGIS